MSVFSKRDAEDRPEQHDDEEHAPQCAFAAFQRELVLFVVLVPGEVQRGARREEQGEDLPAEELGVRKRLLEPRPDRGVERDGCLYVDREAEPDEENGEPEIQEAEFVDAA